MYRVVVKNEESREIRNAREYTVLHDIEEERGKCAP